MDDPAHARWLVDAMNVIGSRPDGWWRDRAGAVLRLHEALDEWAGREEAEVVLVTDGRWDLPAPAAPGLSVVASPTRRRDAADDEIVRLLARDPDPARVRVVTSDLRLANRCRSKGAAIEGARTFRARIGV